MKFKLQKLVSLILALVFSATAFFPFIQVHASESDPCSCEITDYVVNQEPSKTTITPILYGIWLAEVTDENTDIHLFYKIIKTNDDTPVPEAFGFGTGQASGDDFITIVQTSQPSTSTLTTADYDLAGAISNPTEGIDTTERKDITSITTGQYLTFTLNSTGRSWASTTGYTFLGLREGHDVINSSFSGTANQYNGLNIRTSDFTGTSTDPILEITYNTSTFDTIAYLYDPDGNRVKQTVNSSSTHTTYYPSRFYNIINSTSTKHIYAGNLLIATVVGTGSSTQVRYIHSDHLGGTNIVTDANGAQVELIDYFPFGASRLDEKTGHDELRKFASYVFDGPPELNYLNQRYLHSGNGRFLSQDSAFLAVGDINEIKKLTNLELNQYLADPQGMNGYSYARNNPLINIDIDGNYFLFAKTRAANDIRNNKTNIINAANQYSDVRPEMVAGVIYQERKDNVNVRDALTDRPLGNLGWNPSIGLGQVRVSTLTMLMGKGYLPGLDSYSFSAMGVDVTGFLTDDQKYTSLLSNDQYNTTVVAAYLQYLIDTWKGEYSNIANDPAILGTLYNLGHEQTTPNSNPQANEFGQAVANNMNHTKSLLKK